MHVILKILQIVAAIGVCTSSIYYLLGLWSAAYFLREKSGPGCVSSDQPLPPVSVLKPLRGIDPEIYESFRSHCQQDYPHYEIIFGVSDPQDPAIALVKSLQAEFPDRRIELMICPKTLGANVKVSNLAQMVEAAHFDFLIVNDSDIRVVPDYLRRVAMRLSNPQVGMVTCLYRGVAAATLGSRLESLGISTDFCVGVLVARQIERGIRFGLGSTLAFRRSELKKIGGFLSLVNHLADDYELGSRIASLGFKIELSEVVVDTFVPAYNLRDCFSHQLRWARGVRDARAGGYLGLLSTFGMFWSLLAVAASGARFWSWIALALTLLLRLSLAFTVGWGVLRDRQLWKFAWLIPLRDLFSVAVWIASLCGHTVIWRGRRFHLRDGKLTRIET